MKIDTYSPYQIQMPKTEPVEGISPVRRTDPKVVDRLGLNPEKNLESLKNVYSDKKLKQLGIIECQTCAERTYVDGSDDPGVSFKTPTQIDPEESASLVMAHELEHVSNEQADADKAGREVVSQSVQLHSAICPECGVAYIAGGVTKTVTRNKKEYGLPEELVKGLKVDNKV